MLHSNIRCPGFPGSEEACNVCCRQVASRENRDPCRGRRARFDEAATFEEVPQLGVLADRREAHKSETRKSRKAKLPVWALY